MSDEGALQSRVLAFLQSHSVMTLATSEPWAAAVFYVNDGWTLYYLSSPRSRHAQTLARDARVAATIQDDQDDWRAIRGVQLEGSVEAVASADEARVRALYADKFPVIGGVGATIAAPIAKALERIRWYRLQPSRLWFVDNTAGFGTRCELRM
jgi:uncharacterized protein YhbP (UPF0306 family)